MAVWDTELFLTSSLDLSEWHTQLSAVSEAQLSLLAEARCLEDAFAQLSTKPFLGLWAARLPCCCGSPLSRVSLFCLWWHCSLQDVSQKIRMFLCVQISHTKLVLSWNEQIKGEFTSQCGVQVSAVTFWLGLLLWNYNVH